LMGKNYKIKMDKDFLNDDGTPLLGHINYDEQFIKLESGVSRKSQEDTLTHEILHGILHHSGISKCLDNKNLEEGVVMAIAGELHNLGVGKFLGGKYLK